MDLILSIAIIIIILNIAILNTGFIDKIKLNNEVLKLERDINNLRIEALKNKIKTKFLIKDRYTYILSEGGKTKEVVDLKNITISSKEYSYEFNTNGTPTKSGTIQIKFKGGYWDLTISPVTGKLNLKK